MRGRARAGSRCCGARRNGGPSPVRHRRRRRRGGRRGQPHRLRAHRTGDRLRRGFVRRRQDCADLNPNRFRATPRFRRTVSTKTATARTRTSRSCARRSPPTSAATAASTSSEPDGAEPGVRIEGANALSAEVSVQEEDDHPPRRSAPAAHTTRPTRDAAPGRRLRSTYHAAQAHRSRQAMAFPLACRSGPPGPLHSARRPSAETLHRALTALALAAANGCPRAP